jgi:hypothetical protein
MSLKSWLSEIASSFQPAADKVKSLKWNPVQQELIDLIWSKMGPTLQAALWALVTIIIKKYGPEVGQKLFQSILDNLKKQGVEVA